MCCGLLQPAGDGGFSFQPLGSGLVSGNKPSAKRDCNTGFRLCFCNQLLMGTSNCFSIKLALLKFRTYRRSPLRKTANNRYRNIILCVWSERYFYSALAFKSHITSIRELILVACNKQQTVTCAEILGKNTISHESNTLLGMFLYLVFLDREVVTLGQKICLSSEVILPL